MRHGTQGRRSRNRGHGGGGGGNGGGQGGHNNGQRRGVNRNQIFDSNGPDVRIRGTAHQVCEKYLALAKDAGAAGDVVLAESYLQHAEHYQRIINSWNDEFQAFQQRQGFVANGQQSADDDLALPASILGGDAKAPADEGVRAQSFESEEMLETA
jgi:hypothetical protein